MRLELIANRKLNLVVGRFIVSKTTSLEENDAIFFSFFNEVLNAFEYAAYVFHDSKVYFQPTEEWRHCY